MLKTSSTVDRYPLELACVEVLKDGGAVRIRPVHWAAILQDFQLGWAEGNRLACLQNLGPLSNVARAFGADDPAQPPLMDLASRVYGTHFTCPEEGEYQAFPEARSVQCSVHGTTSAPRQPAKPAPKSDLGRLLRHLKGLTATLTFTGEGLRAVVEIQRK